jgi:MerR family transcriptional regulator, light-induced transcriptional regulator
MAPRVPTDPGRASTLAILATLRRRERTVQEIVRATGLSQSNVSNHLARLRAQGVVTSRRAGRFVHYTARDSALIRFALERARQSVDGEPPDEYVEALRQRLTDALFPLDEAEARDVVDEALAAGVPIASLYARVLTPAMHAVGEWWACGEIGVAEEHQVTGLVTRLVARIAETLADTPEPRGTVVVACAEGELHDLGARMLADLFTLRGWHVRFLGANVPVASLELHLRERPADLVLLSVSGRDYLAAACRAAEMIEGLRNGGPRPGILVGGQAVREGSVECAVDLCTPDPLAALEAAEAWRPATNSA